MNTVMLQGNLGIDPVIRYTQAGTPVANFNLATNEYHNDKASGTTKKVTEWHRIVAWNKLATLAENYLAKGRKITVLGKNQTREWTDKDGIKRYTTEVVINRIEFADSPQGAPQNVTQETASVVAPEYIKDDIPF